MLTNKHPDQCHNCHRNVKAGEGRLERSVGAPGWLVMHHTRADCDAAVIAQPPRGGGGWTRDDAMFQSMQADF